MAKLRAIPGLLLLHAALALGLGCGADDDDGGAAGSAGTTAGTAAPGGGVGAAPAGGGGASGMMTAGTGAASGAGSGGSSASSCVGADVKLDTPASGVKPSGSSGSIGQLSALQKQQFCDWLWALPGYGEAYCCPGVLKPLHASVADDETRAGCVALLDTFDACPKVEIGAFESCAIDRIGHYCSTPPGCFAFGHGGLTSTCLDGADAGP